MTIGFRIIYERDGMRCESVWYGRSEQSVVQLFKAWHPEVKVLSIEKKDIIK